MVHPALLLAGSSRRGDNSGTALSSLLGSADSLGPRQRSRPLSPVVPVCTHERVGLWKATSGVKEQRA